MYSNRGEGSKKISRLMKEFKGRCFYCGRRVRIGSQPCATIDHVVPKANGGRGLHNNTVLCCLTCNQIKQSSSTSEFKKELISFVNAMKEKVKIMEEEEKAAYLYGAQMAAEYSTEIGKTDLATMTPEEILTLSECFCKNYHSKIIELQNK